MKILSLLKTKMSNGILDQKLHLAAGAVVAYVGNPLIPVAYFAYQTAAYNRLVPVIGAKPVGTTDSSVDAGGCSSVIMQGAAYALGYTLTSLALTYYFSQ